MKKSFCGQFIRSRVAVVADKRLLDIPSSYCEGSTSPPIPVARSEQSGCECSTLLRLWSHPFVCVSAAWAFLSVRICWSTPNDVIIGSFPLLPPIDTSGYNLLQCWRDSCEISLSRHSIVVLFGWNRPIEKAEIETHLQLLLLLLFLISIVKALPPLGGKNIQIIESWIACHTFCWIIAPINIKITNEPQDSWYPKNMPHNMANGTTVQSLRKNSHLLAHGGAWYVFSLALCVQFTKANWAQLRCQPNQKGSQRTAAYHIWFNVALHYLAIMR